MQHRTSRLLARLTLCVVLLPLLVTGAHAQVPAQDEVLVPGTPPLTRQMVAQMSAFYSRVLDVRLTEEQLRDIHADLVDSWSRNDRDEIESNRDVLQLEQSLDQLGADERALVQQQLQTALLADLRTSPDSPGARWVLAVYDAAHRPIADGHPPLTRQAADAYAEMILFMSSVGLDGAPVVLDPTTDRAFKDGFAAALVADYSGGRLSEEEQQEVAGVPLYWAALRVAWPQLAAEEQTAYQDQWAQQFAALRPTDGSATEPSSQSPVGAGIDAPVVSGTPQSLADLRKQAANLSLRNQNLSRWMGGESVSYQPQTCLVPIGFSCYRP